jgi:hypothetical protein
MALGHWPGAFFRFGSLPDQKATNNFGHTHYNWHYHHGSHFKTNQQEGLKLRLCHLFALNINLAGHRIGCH